MKNKRLPEIHVYRSFARPDSVVWRDGDKEVDLTTLSVTAIRRDIQIADLPITDISFIATLVEHQEDQTA